MILHPPAAPATQRNILRDPEPWDRLCPSPALREAWRTLTWSEASPVLEVVERTDDEVVFTTVPAGRRCALSLERWREVAHGSWLPGRAR